MGQLSVNPIEDWLDISGITNLKEALSSVVVIYQPHHQDVVDCILAVINSSFS